MICHEFLISLLKKFRKINKEKTEKENANYRKV